MNTLHILLVLLKALATFGLLCLTAVVFYIVLSFLIEITFGSVKDNDTVDYNDEEDL